MSTVKIIFSSCSKYCEYVHACSCIVSVLFVLNNCSNTSSLSGRERYRKLIATEAGLKLKKYIMTNWFHPFPTLTTAAPDLMICVFSLKANRLMIFFVVGGVFPVCAVENLNIQQCGLRQRPLVPS